MLDGLLDGVGVFVIVVVWGLWEGKGMGVIVVCLFVCLDLCTCGGVHCVGMSWGIQISFEVFFNAWIESHIFYVFIWESSDIFMTVQDLKSVIQIKRRNYNDLRDILSQERSFFWE